MKLLIIILLADLINEATKWLLADPVKPQCVTLSLSKCIASQSKAAMCHTELVEVQPKTRTTNTKARIAWAMRINRNKSKSFK